MAGGISIHGVDVERGVPAVGMRVEVHALEPERRLVASGRLCINGTLDHPIKSGVGIVPGTYELIFHAGEFFLAFDEIPAGEKPFLDQVPFRFIVADADQHYHLPLKITPWGFSLFRAG